MRITRKGQVTIPQDVRQRLGLLPSTEVEFEVVGDHVRLRKAGHSSNTGARKRDPLRSLRGSADVSMSTVEIMELTRNMGCD